MPGLAVVVTDSTASLPPWVAQARAIVVVPLQVVIGATVYDEGPGGATPEMVAEALKEFRPVSTSRPSPAYLLEVYEKAAADAAAAARERAARSRSLFYVDTLEYLRRGGRIGAAAALVGGALAVKPLLEIVDGRVVTLERVRTSARALARLEELAVQAAGSEPVDVTVAHLASPDRAGQLQERLADRLAENLGDSEVGCAELGAVLGAHVGPGMLAVCVAPLL